MTRTGIQEFEEIAKGMGTDDIPIPRMPAGGYPRAQCGVDVEVVVPEIHRQLEQLALAVDSTSEGCLFNLAQWAHVGVVAALAGAFREHRGQRLVQCRERRGILRHAR